MTTIYLLDLTSGAILEETPPGHNLLIWLYRERFFSKQIRFLIARFPVFSRLYAAFQKSSFSKSAIQPFIQRFHIDTSEFLEPVENFQNFAAFFERRLNADVRPIDPDPDCFISPADGRLKMVDATQSLDVKGRPFSLKQLFQSESLASRFEEALLLTVRLAPQDYHRVHAPFSGRLKKIYCIDGPLYSVSPIALLKNPTILQENKRVVLDFETFVLVLVGATFVGTIHCHLQEGQVVQKGDEIGYFSFGGSMCVLALPKEAKLEEKMHFPQGEVLVKMGQKIAVR